MTEKVLEIYKVGGCP